MPVTVKQASFGTRRHKIKTCYGRSPPRVSISSAEAMRKRCPNLLFNVTIKWNVAYNDLLADARVPITIQQSPAENRSLNPRHLLSSFWCDVSTKQQSTGGELSVISRKRIRRSEQVG